MPAVWKCAADAGGGAGIPHRCRDGHCVCYLLNFSLGAIKIGRRPGSSAARSVWGSSLGGPVGSMMLSAVG